MFQYSSLFFIFAFFLTTFNGNPINSYIPECPSFTCGNLNIHYPFWQSNSNPNTTYCGYPGFGLSCTNQRPIFHVPTDSYYVTQINYTQNSLTLVDMHLVDQSCPRAKHNVSFSFFHGNTKLFPLMNYNSIDLNLVLTFFFNCSSFPSYLGSIECLNSGRNRSFVFGGGLGEIPRFDWHGNCEECVKVPLMETEAKGLTLGGFGGSVARGFQVDWFVARTCGVCEASHGYCGYSNRNRSFVCYCEDGRHPKDCHDNGMSLI
ncbi:hypothetical protein MRB53_004675 [Persea americana]|uniref:Uncharacterized protein n=1 Tax=Persea americana TaxID=3435 RepID=A0ACC2MAW0_PERAE|nr:hypothetical protein MRB53_004675 [Persea americana]